MNKNSNFSLKLWEIMYPVLMYYTAITVGMFLAQLVFGTSNESYMLCKIIGSLTALPVVYADYKRDRIMTGRYGEKIPLDKFFWTNVLKVAFISLALSVALNNLISMSPLMEMSAEYENASNAFYGSSIALELLGSALITPLLEELLHRGVVYGRLRRRMGMWPAVVVSSLIFAMLHFNIVQFTYAFLLGLVLAIFVEKTGHIYPAVLAHVLANGLAVIRTETGFLMELVSGTGSAWASSFLLLLAGGIALERYYKGNNQS